jgi:sigma-E factor negative regulatory protein RseC
MLTEVGRIIAVEQDAVWVETIRQSTCGSCAAQKGCGHGILNRFTDGSRSYVRVLPGEIAVSDCQVDDSVRISIPEEVILHGSFIVYILPLLAMLAGAIAVPEMRAGNQDALAALGAVAGLAVGFSGVRWHASRHSQDPAFQPVLVEIVPPAGEPLNFAS